MKNLHFFNTKASKISVPIKLVTWSPLMKIISWLLIISMLNLFTGCMNYFKVRKATGSVEENIDDLNRQNKPIILHLDDKAWILNDIDISSDNLKAKTSKEYSSILQKPVKPDGANRYRTKKTAYDQSSVLNEVHVYTTELSRYPNSMQVSVPLTSIQKIEVYEKDQATTFGSWSLGILGAAAGTFLLITIIILLTKSSCPFIYTFDGENYAFAGEIYSGSIQPNLERHDFLKLPVYNISNREYQLKISNEVKEIQHTNLMELWVFDHSPDLEIWIDKYGNYHSAFNLISPVSAKNFKGTDISELIANRDSLFYTSSITQNELSLTDGIIVEFQKPDNAKNAKLLVRAKNSYVLDYMVGQFHNQFGNLYEKWNKKQRKAPPEQLRQWTLNQNIPLTLSIQRNGVWEHVDYYNIAGPMAFKEDILSFPLNGTEGNPLRIKLESGNFFWDIDYTGIDFTDDIELNYQVIRAISAIDQNGRNVIKQIGYDDNKYYIQPEVGDKAAVIFELPETVADSRSIFLHSKGWYQILRNPSGTPDREYLETFRQPGRFNRFVNEYMQSMVQKY